MDIRTQPESRLDTGKILAPAGRPDVCHNADILQIEANRRLISQILAGQIVFRHSSYIYADTIRAAEIQASRYLQLLAEKSAADRAKIQARKRIIAYCCE